MWSLPLWSFLFVAVWAWSSQPGGLKWGNCTLPGKEPPKELLRELGVPPLASQASLHCYPGTGGWVVSDFPQPPRSCLALSPAEKRVLTASPAHWPYSLEVDLPQVSSPAINYNSQLNPWQTPPTLFLSHSLSSVLVYQWLYVLLQSSW